MDYFLNDDGLRKVWNKTTLLLADKVNIEDYNNASYNLESEKITGILPIEKGGTGATTATQARTNLGIVSASSTTEGLMSASDKILLDKYRANNLGDMNGKTISDLRSILANWINIVYDTPNATAYCSGDMNDIIDPWNNENLSTTIGAGGRIIFTLKSTYSSGNYALIEVTLYQSKLVYYIAYRNNIWEKIYQVQFTDDNFSTSRLTSGTLPVTRGGTGLTASPSMLINLGSTTAANVFAASPRPGITGTLDISHGGTGATSALGARQALRVFYGTTAERDAHSAQEGDVWFVTD